MPIDRITLVTDAYPAATPLILPVDAWTTEFTANPKSEFVHQTDWSGGVGQRMFPVERRLSEGPILSNMAFRGRCWTYSGDEIMAGPLRTACGGTAITASAIQYFTLYGNKLYFASGAKKYYTDASTNPTEVDSGGSATITDIKEIGANLVVCLGTATLHRQYDGTNWSAGTTYPAVIATVDNTTYWASNPTSGGAASFLYWGTAASQRAQIWEQAWPITNIIEVDKEPIIFKRYGLYTWNAARKKAFRLQSLPDNPNTGVAAAVYNNALYFSAGQGLYVWRGQGVAVPVATPRRLDDGQIGQVYSLAPCGDALIVGFKGYAYLMEEFPAQSGYYWWHYLAYNSGKTFRDVIYNNQIGLSRPRIYYGFSGDTTNNIQYTEFIDETMTPYEFETGTNITFPGIYMGSELYDMWLRRILCGTSGCDANKTIQWAYSSTLASGGPATFTNIGSAITSNGFQTIVPASDVEGNIIWPRIVIVTNSATSSPSLHFWSVQYFPRDPAKRRWKFRVPVSLGASIPGGGKVKSIQTYETALYNARNQTSPCVLTIPAQDDVSSVKVWLDIRFETQRSDPKKSDVTKESFNLWCEEAV